jgi:hypothetical protein
MANVRINPSFYKYTDFETDILPSNPTEVIMAMILIICAEMSNGSWNGLPNKKSVRKTEETNIIRYLSRQLLDLQTHAKFHLDRYVDVFKVGLLCMERG